jgi:hypothetical protein
MIKPYDVIKHKASMDVAIQVFFTSVDPETGNTLVDGIWLNQGYVETMPINCRAEFFIRPEHLKNWLKCMKPDAILIRNEKWEPLT